MNGDPFADIGRGIHTYVNRDRLRDVATRSEETCREIDRLEDVGRLSGTHAMIGTSSIMFPASLILTPPDAQVNVTRAIWVSAPPFTDQLSITSEASGPRQYG